LLSIDGKWILFGLLSGAKTNLNLATLIGKRISLISTTLKTRTDEYKASLIEDFRQTALFGFDKGVLRPIIYKTFPCDWSSVDPFVEAHKLMESNTNVGKIMIEFK
jgi:tumor protein p53-inducible protein 3